MILFLLVVCNVLLVWSAVFAIAWYILENCECKSYRRLDEFDY